MSFLRKRIIFIVSMVALMLTFSAGVWAVSLSPEVVEKLRREGKLEEWAEKARDMRARGVWAPNPDPPVLRAPKGEIAQDTLRPFVLCIDFSDNVAVHDTSEFSFLLFSKDFALSTGSFRDYYLENSYDMLDANGAVYGWVRAPQTYAYYVDGDYGTGPYPTNCQRMVEDALNIADPYVDFRDFDYDGNGAIDGLIVVHAGPGAEESGSTGDVWSHEWVMLTTQYHDGISMRQYTMNPERHPGGGLVEIGVFCHEFGHFMGAVDLYDYGYDSEGVGDFSVMASGSWLNSGQTPCHFDAYHKYKILNFLSANWVQSNLTNAEIPQVETSPTVFRLAKNASLMWEYFLVENRQRTGFDSYLPGDGLLIWHVDQNAGGGGHPNDNQWCPGDPPHLHYRVALEQADGKWELEACPGYSNSGTAADVYPGSYDVRAFDDTTTPSSRGYPDTTTRVAVWDISDSDSVMYANFDITWSRPCAVMDNFIIDDTFGGDGDGRPEPGETVRIYFTISNLWLPVTGVNVTASADTAGIIFTDDYSYLGDLGEGGSANNYSDPIEFQVASDFPGRPTIFTMHLEGNGGSYTRDFDEQVWAGAAELLLVDAAGGYQSYYTTHLDSMRLLHDIWEAQLKVDPDFSFRLYKYVLWYTGDHQTNLFSHAQVESLISFLDGGGRLFLTSQDAIEVLAGSADPSYQHLLTHYLHLGYDGNNTDLLVANKPGDEIGDDLWIFPGGPDSPENQTSKDNLVPDAEADTVLRYAGIWWEPTGGIAAIKFVNEIYKVVVFGFGFEGINTSGSVYYGQQLNEEFDVLQTVLNWLRAPGPTINVMYPNGGEDWFVDSTYCIEWESISFDDSVKIEYSIDAGATWSTMVETTTNDGEYCWTVPDTPSDSCLIIISDVDNGIPADTSDDYFRIVNYISVMAPNGGESWFVGSTYDILWYSVSTKDSVKIEYSTDAGATWSAIAETTTNDGIYSWTVPETVSDSCLVSVSDVVDGIPVDISDDLFSIIDYVPGDANGNLVVDVADAVFLLNYLFKGGDPPVPMASGDVNSDCLVDLADAIYILNYLFRGGDPPQPGCA
jgi:immune inhibitor A